MHLTLVPKRTFDFSEADFDVPIPADLPIDEDAPAPGLPDGLADLRYFFSDWEAGRFEPPYGDPENAFWCVRFAEYFSEEQRQRQHDAGIVPLVSHRLVAPQIHEVFAQWQAARPGDRERLSITIETAAILGGDCSPRGIVVRFEEGAAQ